MLVLLKVAEPLLYFFAGSAPLTPNGLFFSLSVPSRLLGQVLQDGQNTGDRLWSPHDKVLLDIQALQARD